MILPCAWRGNPKLLSGHVERREGARIISKKLQAWSSSVTGGSHSMQEGQPKSAASAGETRIKIGMGSVWTLFNTCIHMGLRS